MDVPLPHLDRPFDYLVPAEHADAAQPGVRARVRFAGQLVDGFVLERVGSSDHAGRLAYLERVTSSERVLTPETLRLARAVADRYAGTLADVLRLAVPPRHAKAESEPAQATSPGGRAADVPGAAWSDYVAGPAYLAALREGRAPRAVAALLPGEDWPARLAEAAAAALAGGRGAVLVVPDARDLDRLESAIATTAPGRCVALSAALGPAERYRRFVRAGRAARAEEPLALIGTRAAMFAPVARLGLAGIWDDGDDLHAEPRAPYPHAREVLLTRAQLAGAGALVAGHSRTAEAQLLLAAGWAREIAADRRTVRARAPRVTPIGDDAQLARDPAAAQARLPSVAWRAARDALAAGAPVLVQVPRRGYLPSVHCADCRQPARCSSCSGPLALAGASSAAACRWCGHVAVDFACARCGQRRLRASVVGARRTAEELGRAFPGTPVRTSGRDGVLAAVPPEAALVIATPGAEPLAAGGYGAALLLDTWALLTRTDLRAGEEALRRWLAVACLVRPASDGGHVVVVADGGLAPVQALLRFDPAWHAERELAERSSLGFPPAVRMASLTGAPDAVGELLSVAELPDGADVLGPVPLPGRDDGEESLERALVRVRRGAGPALAAALHAASGVRSARKARTPARVQIDPLDLL
ncbi:MAG: primosome assembly protein PriA [Micromonosporaceae bacterium]|nr:primosome assembly protein PriA [Micromonosporaceae bacterium]